MYAAFRIVGTITRRQATEIEVKKADGKRVSICLKKDTIVLRDRVKVPATELKPGRTVVVDALGDDEFDLEAQQVRIAPAIPPAPAKRTPR